MNLKRKYWILSLGFISLAFCFLAGLGSYFWLSLDPRTREIFWANSQEVVGIVFIGGLLLLAAILFFLNEMFHAYIVPLDKLTEDSGVMATVNPAHRSSIKGCREIMLLAERMNQVAGRIEHLQRQLEDRSHTACIGVEEENEYLAEMISRLPIGVVACNAWNEVFLYNREARNILSRALGCKNPGALTSCFLGLGRPMTHLLEQEVLEQALESVSCRELSSPPVCRFRNEKRLERPVDFKILPLCEEQGTSEGYVVVLDEPGQGALSPESGEESAPAGQESGLVIHQARDREADEESYVSCRDLDLWPLFAEDWSGLFDFDLLLRPVPKPPFGNVELKKLPCTIFDLETTGLNPKGGDTIVSVSAVRIVNGKILPEEPYHQLVDPCRSIPDESCRIHGITEDMVRGKPVLREVLPYFYRYAEGSVLISHCAEFDMLFLRRSEGEAGVAFDNPLLDTLLLAALVLPSRKDQTLEAIARRLGTQVYSRHTSLGDALTAAEIYLKLQSLLAMQGIHTFGQAREACERIKKHIDYSGVPTLCSIQSC